MRMTHHRLSRNFLGWIDGACTLEIEYRGTKEELLQKIKDEIEKDLVKNA